MTRAPEPQLSYRFRSRHYTLHRRMGRVLLTAGVISGAFAITFGIRLAFGGASEAWATVVFGSWHFGPSGEETSDTPFFSFSIGKGMAATVVHVLAERGALDYDTPIVSLWTEFGAHGKQKATVRHALS